jgi:hypothetical protein
MFAFSHMHTGWQQLSNPLVHFSLDLNSTIIVAYTCPSRSSRAEKGSITGGIAATAHAADIFKRDLECLLPMDKCSCRLQLRVYFPPFPGPFAACFACKEFGASFSRKDTHVLQPLRRNMRRVFSLENCFCALLGSSGLPVQACHFSARFWTQVDTSQPKKSARAECPGLRTGICCFPGPLDIQQHWFEFMRFPDLNQHETRQATNLVNVCFSRKHTG